MYLAFKQFKILCVENFLIRESFDSGRMTLEVPVHFPKTVHTLGLQGVYLVIMLYDLTSK